MAFVQDVMDEEENNQQQPGGVVTTSGSSSGVVGQGTQTPQASKPKGSSWTNLQNYISANAGNDAAMGNRIAGKIGEQAAGVERAKSALTPKVEQDVQANTVADTGVIGALQTDPTKVAKDAFKKQSTAVYRGPEDVSAYQEYGQGQKAKSALTERLDLTKSAEGQGALLKDIAGQNYTQGLQSLDQFILGAGEQGKKSIANTQSKYGNVASDWDALTGQLNQKFKQAKETTTKTAADTRKAFEDAFGTTTGAIKGAETKAQQTNEQRRAEVKGIEDAFTRGDTKTIEQKLGIPAKTVIYLRNTLGFTPQEIISYAGDMNLGDFTSPKEIARYQALLDLGDRASEFSFTPSGIASQPVNVKRDIVNAAEQAKAIRDQIVSETARRNEARYREWVDLDRKIRQGEYDDQVARATGLSRKEFIAARRGEYMGEKVDPLNFQRGKQLNFGDVATDAQRSQWANLMAALGGRDRISLSDTQDEGGAFALDTSAIKSAVARGDERVRQDQERARKAEEEAAAIRKRREFEEMLRRENLTVLTPEEEAELARM